MKIIFIYILKTIALIYLAIVFLIEFFVKIIFLSIVFLWDFKLRYTKILDDFYLFHPRLLSFILEKNAL